MNTPIYVVDDDGTFRASMLALLAAARLVGRGFPSGADFLQEAGNLRPGILLLDLSMPEMSGLEVLRELSTRQHYFTPILLTGYKDTSASREALALGAVCIIDKPCEFSQLLAHIEQAASIYEAAR